MHAAATRKIDSLLRGGMLAAVAKSPDADSFNAASRGQAYGYAIPNGRKSGRR
jgi:hypothetical protein